MSQRSHKSITVRFPSDLFQAAKQAAEQRDDSFNSFVTESVRARLKVHEERALYDSFSKLGDDAEESSVDFGFEAQSEVVSGGD